MKNPYEECPSFDRCSCNVCPLDPDVRDKEALAGESKCIAHKPTRIKVAERYLDVLSMGGLTSREFQGKRTWEALSQAKRQEILEAGVKGLKTVKNRLSRASVEPYKATQ